MKLRSVLFASVLAALLAPLAKADPVSLSLTGQVTSASSTQLGRPSRSGTAQTWTGAETYTGQINTTTTYYYNTYTFAASNFIGASYIEISVYDVNNSSAFFVSAFANSYSTASRGTNWLGDVGSSGNIRFYSGDPGEARTFQVILPQGSDLVLLVNSTLGGTNGLNNPFEIYINGYGDTNYSDPLAVAATPEPGSLLLALTGVAGTVAAARRRLFAA